MNVNEMKSALSDFLSDLSRMSAPVFAAFVAVNSAGCLLYDAPAVDCYGDEDCPGTDLCHDLQVCGPACQSSEDCDYTYPGRLACRSDGHCVICVEDADCSDDGSSVCHNDTCRKVCENDNDCDTNICLKAHFCGTLSERKTEESDASVPNETPVSDAATDSK